MDKEKILKEFKEKESKIFKDFMFDRKVFDIIEFKENGNKKSMVSLDSETSISDSLEILRDSKVFSAIIFKQPDSNPSNSFKDFENNLYINYIGMMGTFEIISFMLGMFFEDTVVVTCPYTGEKVTVGTWKSAKLKEITKHYSLFKDTPIRDTINLNPHVIHKSGNCLNDLNPLDRDTLKTCVYENDNIILCLKAMVTSNMMRLPVVSGNSNKIEGVISESDILLDLIKLGDENLPSLLKEQILVFQDELIDGSYWKVEHDTITSNVFQIMESKKQQSVAIMKDHQLFYNFSLSDLKGITISNIEDLNLPVYEYLHKYGTNVKPTNDSIQFQIPITITLNTSILSVLKIMVQSKIHGIWVFNQEAQSNEIIGYISMKSLSKFIYNLVKQL